MKVMGPFLFLLIFFVFVSGFIYVLASSGGLVEKKTVTTEVERIFMHRPDEYSFQIYNSEAGFFDTLYIKNVRNIQPGEENMCHGTKGVIPKTYTDVPLGKKAWITFDEFYCADRASYANHPVIANLEIHAHNLTQINGAGWERSCGKGCIEKGTTIPIE